MFLAFLFPCRLWAFLLDRFKTVSFSAVRFNMFCDLLASCVSPFFVSFLSASLGEFRACVFFRQSFCRPASHWQTSSIALHHAVQQWKLQLSAGRPRSSSSSGQQERQRQRQQRRRRRRVQVKSPQLLLSHFMYGNLAKYVSVSVSVCSSVSVWVLSFCSTLCFTA